MSQLNESSEPICPINERSAQSTNRRFVYDHQSTRVTYSSAIRAYIQYESKFGAKTRYGFKADCVWAPETRCDVKMDKSFAKSVDGGSCFRIGDAEKGIPEVGADVALDLLEVAKPLGAASNSSSQVPAIAEVGASVRYGQLQVSASYDAFSDKVKGTLSFRPFCPPGFAFERRVRLGTGAGGTVYRADKN